MTPIAFTMARTESDKEDLIAEATALVERTEYIPTAVFPWQTVTVGFKKDGSCSLYLDQDPFYQFDSRGYLRRAHVGGLLYRSQSATLAQLRRERNEQQTILHRTDLFDDQLADFHRQMTSDLQQLSEALSNGQLKKSRSVPENLCQKQRTMEFLETIAAHGTDFLSSSIRTRR